MARKTIISLKDGKRRISLTKTINIVVVNEMKPFIDATECSASYSWEWLADKILDHHKLLKDRLVSYQDFLEKVKQSYHRVKNPDHATFNPRIDTYYVRKIGTRLVKLSHKTPELVRNLVTRQKEQRLYNAIDTHNQRLQSRNKVLGKSGIPIEYKEV